MTSVWRDMVVIASLWARMVGRSTSTASIDSMRGFWLMRSSSLREGAGSNIVWVRFHTLEVLPWSFVICATSLPLHAS